MVELLINIGFETNTGQEYPPNGGTATGWVSTGEMYTEGWWPHAGSWAMYHYSWLGLAGECYQEVDVIGGEVYTYTIWTKQDDVPSQPECDFYIELAWYDAGNILIDTDSQIVPKTASYTQQTLTATAPSSAVKVRVLFRGTEGATQGSSGFDDASFYLDRQIYKQDSLPTSESKLTYVQDTLAASEFGQLYKAGYLGHAPMHYNAFSIYFDDGVSFDDVYYFDSSGLNTATIVATVDCINTRHYSDSLTIDMYLDIDEDSGYAKFLDLMLLVPEKFRESVALQQFLSEAGLQVGTWIGSINDMVQNLDPYNVSDDYVQYLADLIGFTIQGDDTTDISEKRRQLTQAVAWYKMKGTYRSLQYAMYLSGININIWDMYTNDYVTFVQEPWFTGAVGENPPGLDSSYYKSPHIGIEMVLDTVLGSASDPYLFDGTAFTAVSPYFEQTRPVNVVIEYYISLNPITDKTGVATTVPGDIKTCVIGDDWSALQYNFDASASSSLSTAFDDGMYFDFGYGFLSSINKYKLGTGNKGVSPDTSGFDLQTVVLTGDVTSFTQYTDRVEYLIMVPNTTVQAGVSELGLYLSDGTTLEIASTFPDVDITTGIGTRILLKLYK